MATSGNIKVEKQRQITCLLPKGSGHDLMERLKEEKGVTTVGMSHARGIGTAVAGNSKDKTTQVEKDVVTAIVPEKMADEIFQFLYFEGNLNRPHGGFIYMSKSILSTKFSLPNLPDSNA